MADNLFCFGDKLKVMRKDVRTWLMGPLGILDITRLLVSTGRTMNYPAMGQVR